MITAPRSLSIAACLVVLLGLLVEVSPGVGTAATSQPRVSVGANVVVGAGDGYVDLPISLSASGTQTVTWPSTRQHGTPPRSAASRRSLVMRSLGAPPGELPG